MEFEPIPILWRGKNALVVEKPAGVSTTSPPNTDGLLWRLKSQLREQTDYVTPVHRLDREVGGVLLVATSKRAARLLSAQFEARRIEKVYQAWLHGRYDGDSGIWTDWLRKIDGQPKAEVVTEHTPKAQAAETNYRVLSYEETNNRTLMELSPVTGRMHQLRIQCSSRGVAIVGDTVYGEERSATPLQLRAFKIGFYDPNTGQRVVVEM